MAFHRESLLVGLVPHVLSAAITFPRLDVDAVVSEDGESRHAVLGEVLVLIVAPDQHEVGLESVELAPDLPELVDHVLAMPVGVRLALILSPLAAHRRVPVLG